MGLRRFKIVIAALSAVCLLLLVVGLLPHSSVTVPEWRVQVVDRNQNPVPNRRIIQIWMNLTFESANDTHQEERFTDASGTVVFPERKVSASLIRRGWGLVKERLDFLPHTSYGPFAAVFVEGPSDSLTYKGGSLPGHVIVVRDE